MLWERGDRKQATAGEDTDQRSLMRGLGREDSDESGERTWESGCSDERTQTQTTGLGFG